jgi:Regulator of chromosome condensation (RCC1) repeat
MAAPLRHRGLVRLRLAALLVAFLGWPVVTPTVAAEPSPGVDQVVAIAAGGTHALALRADGTVWGWGTNSDWELGVTTPSGPGGSDTPVQATGLAQVRSIATGDDHGLALRADGSVWAWGKNDHGQVGVPQGANCPYHPRPCVQAPVPVPGLRAIKAVAAARDSSFALGADGTVWAWGDNGNRQLGLGSGGDHGSPVGVAGVSAIESLSAESARVVALRGDGTVWSWGGSPEQAIPAPVSALEDVGAVAAGAVRSLALKADGTAWAWGGKDTRPPEEVAGLGPLTAIVGGALVSGAVAADGTVWVWVNTAGTPAKPPARVDGLRDIVAIALSSDGNLALKADGTVWRWRLAGTPQQVPAPATGTPTT